MQISLHQMPYVGCMLVHAKAGILRERLKMGFESKLGYGHAPMHYICPYTFIDNFE
jgi:hypothetical protein